ncbi:MAG: (2Fe-2S)-binding protein [Candidatus Cloacimonetes bacterium]|nr:(2Fe-2S)-binding protein [Candidatus Cloacimonadota bacterium]
MQKIEINLTVNQRSYELKVKPNKRLLDVLRNDLNFTGVKEGCGIGECGACTVIMDGEIVNSCMVLAGQARDSEIITVEDLESENGLHPIQKAFIDAGAVQCGFCTPGMILSTLNLLKENSNPTRSEIKDGLEGNFCRCTGYKQIIDAVELAAEMMRD